MRDTTPLPRHSLLRASVALCLSAALLALAPGAPFPAGAEGADAGPAKSFAAAAAPALQTGGPNVVGQWGPLQTLDTVPVHISMLPDGRLLYWGRDKAADKWDIGGSCLTYTWNPSTGARTTIPNNTTNLFCSGHSLLPDGRLLVTGGHVRDDARPQQEGIGEDDVNIFDYRTNLWRRLATPMPRGRWYPSNVTLANGEVVTISGYYRNSATLALALNESPDLYTSAGTIRPFTAANPIPVYPYLHLAPNNQVFVAGPGPDPSKYFNPVGNGFFTTNVADFAPQHSEGSAVTYDGTTGKVLMMGGRQNFQGLIHSETEAIDLSSPSPFWRSVGSLAVGRKYHTATVLPDGKVLVTGGTRCNGTNDIACLKDAMGNNIGAARNPELWDPQTEMWTTMAANPSGVPRVYHSVAVLLPDGRVLVGGGGLPAAGGEVVPTDTPGVTRTCVDGSSASNDIYCRTFGHKDFEIFSPPYLFTSGGALAARPAITSAPQSVILGRNFSVGKGSTSTISSVALVRLPSVTHGFNFDQRRVALNFSAASSTSLNVSAPADGRACPPGYYMLFIINSAGVPSVARIVQVVAPAPTEMGSRTVRAVDGRLQVFYRGAAGDLVTTAQTSPGATTWSAHTSLGGFITTNPVAVTHTDGRIHVFARGANNILYHQWQTTPGGAWSGWAALGAGVQSTSELAVARNLDGRLQVFFRGTDNALKYVVQVSDDPNAWGPLINLGGGLVTGPTVEANADGRLEVFVVGLDNALYHTWQTAPSSGSSWAGLTGLGGYTNSAQLAASRNTDGWIQVFYRGGSDNALYYIKQSPSGPGGWTSHTSLGGVLTSDPSVVANADGRLEVFVRGTDNGVWHNWQTAPSSATWSGFSGRGGSMTSGPVAARNANGRVSFVIRGANNVLFYNAQTSPGSAAWTGYSTVGGSASTF